jgi:hypothetical protein
MWWLWHGGTCLNRGLVCIISAEGCFDSDGRARNPNSEEMVNLAAAVRPIIGPSRVKPPTLVQGHACRPNAIRIESEEALPMTSRIRLVFTKRVYIPPVI